MSMQESTSSAVSAPLPWHGAVWAKVQQQLERGKMPHAMLIVGPQGIGKNRFAQALARLLLCHQPEAGHNCGHCHACELSATGGHGDYRWVQPEEKSRVIKVDQVRQVVEFGNKTAGFGRCKVVVLVPAQSMNANAANALLKSLEEPAADTYLLLVCDRLQGMPATLRSRCQIVNMPVPDTQTSVAWLEKSTGDAALSAELLTLAQGSPLLAQQIYQQDTVAKLREIQAALESLCSGRATAAQVSPLIVSLSIEEILALLSRYLFALIRSQADGCVSGMTCRRAFGILDEIQRSQLAVQSGANPNRQMLLEALLARIEMDLGRQHYE